MLFPQSVLIAWIRASTSHPSGHGHGRLIGVHGAPGPHRTGLRAWSASSLGREAGKATGSRWRELYSAASVGVLALGRDRARSAVGKMRTRSSMAFARATTLRDPQRMTRVRSFRSALIALTIKPLGASLVGGYAET